ncbi:hypothetical protein COB64_01725 [Candidatus Wolfebacteria bacterium]|nr:MAG: hypothetical protein COB64_01725 [Candidatus Wolfebacteria bacterium]
MKSDSFESMEEILIDERKFNFNTYRNLNTKKRIIFGGALLFVLIFLFVLSAPLQFPKDSTIRIEKGSSLNEVSQLLDDHKIVRSGSVFQFFAIIFGGDTHIVAGDYFFEKRISVISVARRIVKGDYNVTSLKVTIPEGLSRTEIAGIYANALDEFDSEKFLELTAGDEGYLFPDTYFYLPSATSKDVVKQMKDTFDNKISSIQSEIDEFGEELSDVITMASIIEREANRSDERRIISGILWKRIDIGLALQVDATFLFINGKGSAELTLSDLQTDSPYNTYTNKGLPPGPIGNPGLDSIKAAISPETSPYLYYLHGNDGVARYGKTFEEHKKNKQKYL